jgi:hypothetical protein
VAEGRDATMAKTMCLVPAGGFSGGALLRGHLDRPNFRVYFTFPNQDRNLNRVAS